MANKIEDDKWFLARLNFALGSYLDGNNRQKTAYAGGAQLGLTTIKGARL